jgi:cullin-associated NEDD8-dissociated protein 1
VKALATIATSPLEIDLGSVLGDVISELCSFLKKADRPLRQGSLSTLVCLASTTSARQMNSDMHTMLISEAAPLISDSDLYLSQLALQLCTAMLAINPGSATTVQGHVWEPAFRLLQSPLLQNSGAERAAMQLCAQIVQVGAAGFDFQFLLPTVTSCVVGRVIGAGGTPSEVTRQALSSLAQCVASMCSTASAAQCTSTVREFIANVGSGDATVKCLSLLSLGEIGRRFDLSSHENLEGTIIAALSDSSEEVKNAGSFCLGNISVGCMDKYLGIILDAIQSNAGLQYLLLHSLKEIIKRVSEDESKAAILASNTVAMLPLLYENANSAEEGVRNVVAECLGKICRCEPARLDELERMVGSPDAPIRQTVVTAVRHAVSDKDHAIDLRIGRDAGVFLALIDDEDLGVKRAALLTLNTLVHSKLS